MGAFAGPLFWGGAVIGFVLIVWLLKGIMMPFVLGAAIAYLLNPLVEKIESRGLGRKASVLSILGGFSLIVVLFLAIVLPILIREGGDFLAAVPTYIQYIEGKIGVLVGAIQERLGYQVNDRIQTVLQDNMGKTLQVGKTVMDELKGGGEAVVGFLSALFLTPMVAYFMMIEWPSITAWMYDLMPRHSQQNIKDLLGQINVKIAGFVRGQIMVCAALGALYAVALSLANLNYGFVIGLGTGILSIIPYVGSTLGLVTSLVVAYLQSGGDWTFVGVIAIIFFAGQLIEGTIITPKLMGDSVGLHPLWVIFALMAGGTLLGVLGMFLAVPVAAIVGVLAAFAIARYKASAFYKAPSSSSPKEEDPK